MKKINVKGRRKKIGKEARKKRKKITLIPILIFFLIFFFIFMLSRLPVTSKATFQKYEFQKKEVKINTKASIDKDASLIKVAKELNFDIPELRETEIKGEPLMKMEDQEEKGGKITKRLYFGPVLENIDTEIKPVKVSKKEEVVSITGFVSREIGEEYYYINEQNLYKSYFGDRVRFEDGDVYISFEPQGNMSKPILEENTVIYHEVWPNVSLGYALSPYELKEYIILHSYTDNNFDFKISKNVEFDERESHINLLYNGNGIARITRPFAVDSNGTRIDGSFKVTRNNIRVVIDKNFLKSAVYPVIIDPSVIKTNLSNSTELREDATVYVNGANTSYLKFQLKSIPSGANITYANLSLWLNSLTGTNPSNPTVPARNCTNQSWVEANADNRTIMLCQGQTGNDPVIDSEAMSGTNRWYSWNLTDWVIYHFKKYGTNINVTVQLPGVNPVDGIVTSRDNGGFLSVAGIGDYKMANFNSSEAADKTPYLTITYSINYVPTHNNPILNSTNPATNSSQVNLTCYNQSVSDLDNDPVTSIFNWYRNASAYLPYMLVFLPFDIRNLTATKDYSGARNDFNVTNALWTASGQTGGAYLFNGTNASGDVGCKTNITKMNLTPFNFTSGYTISLWIYPYTSDGWGLLVIRNATTNAAIRLMNNDGTTSIEYDVVDGVSEYGNIGGAFVNNQWQLITATFNRTSAFFYRNGVLQQTTPANMSFYNANSIEISWNPAWGQECYNGSVDDVRIYNYSLPASQIQALYQNKEWQITNDSIVAGENWTCEVTISDNMTDSQAKNSTNITILASNTAPSIGTVSIAPSTAYTNSTLNCSTTVTDANNDNVKVNITWYNGSAGTTYYNSSTFSLSGTAAGIAVSALLPAGAQGPGETWNCTVNASDASSDTKKSITKAISNLIPEIINITILPVTAYGNSTLNCSVTPRDNDFDSMTVNFTWYNGSGGTVYYNSSTKTSTNGTQVSVLLPTGIQAGGETWNCSANITDGSASSAPNSTTRAITALQPYVAETNITPITAYGNSTLNCTSLVYDNDLRSIKVNFTWYNGSGGTVYYNSSTKTTTNGSFVSALLPAGIQASGETWNCTVNVSAGTSDGANRNSSTRLISNTIPMTLEVNITPTSPNDYSTLNCTAIVQDDDLQTLTVNFTWYNGSAGTTYYNSSTRTSVSNGSIVSVLLPAGVQGSAETWNCTVFSNDGTTNGNLNSTTRLIGTAGSDACGQLGTSGTYTLTTNVESTGTCFNVTADNITLDCAGFMINYTAGPDLTSSTPGAAVSVISKNYTTIKSCTIVNGNYTLARAIQSPAIFVQNDVNSTMVFNNNITIWSNSTAAANAPVGIYLATRVQNSSVYSNTINTNGTNSYGIDIRSSHNNSVYSNTINTSGVWGIGINSLTASDNLIYLNIIKVTGENGFGIQMGSTAFNNQIHSNKIITAGNSGRGMYLITTFYNNSIYNNSINSTSNWGYGIEIDNSVYNNSIYLNTINATGSTHFGIYVTLNAYNNSVYNNNISTKGSNGPGIFVTSTAYNNSFYSNNITTYSGSGAYAIYLQHQAFNNTFWNNIISANSTRIYIDNSTWNNFTNNTVKELAVTTNSDIFSINNASKNIFLNNSLNKSDIGFGKGVNNFSVQEYIDINITNSSNLAEPNAKVNITNASGTIATPVFSITTNAIGTVGMQAVTEFIANGMYNYTNYTTSDGWTVNGVNNFSLYSPYNVSVFKATYNLNSTNITVNGTNTMQTSTQIALSRNTAPFVDKPFITPVTAYGNSTLNCSTTAYDNDLNTMTVNFTWYNGSTYYNSSTKTSIANGTNVSMSLDSTNIGIQASGETWNCSAFANDGTENGVLNSSTRAITGLQPYVGVVNITPSTAYTNGSLNCTAEVYDDDLRSIKVNFTWYNGSAGTVYYSNVIRTASNGSIVSFNLTDAAQGVGETWNCSVNISAGTAEGFNMNSTTRLISNTAPMIRNVTLLPATAYGNSTLNCTAVAEDIDLSTMTVNFTWYNGSTYYNSSTFSSISNGTSKSFNLDAGVQANGETWNCSVFYNDGTANSALNSTTRTISNTAPTIQNVTILPATAYGNSTLNCTAVAEDIDLNSMTVNFTFYNGSAYYNSSTRTSVTNGTSSSVLLLEGIQASGETWNCSVFANDGSVDSALNSTTRAIIALQPYIGETNITPVTANDYSILNCTALVYDNDLRSIKVNFTWYNGSGGTTYYNSSTFSTTNGSFVSALLPEAVQASAETWNCTINISAGTSDGANRNSSTRLIGTAGTNACGQLGTAGTTYTLTGNVASTGTCFNITADYVTLDCAGYMINYSIGSLDNNLPISAAQAEGYGVVARSKNYTTIKSCTIVNGNYTIPRTHGIYVTGAENSTMVFNNNLTIWSNSTAAANAPNGIYGVTKVSNNSIYNNKINTNGTLSYGIYLATTTYNNSIYTNNINTSGSNGYGIFLSSTVYNNSIYNNNINTSGGTGYGIYLFPTVYNNSIYNNNINTSGSYSYNIILQSTVYNNLIYNNNLTAFGNLLSAIYLFSTAYNNSIYNNNITTSNVEAYGIYLSSTAYNNSIYANNITSLSAVAAYSIYLLNGVQNNSFWNNIISSNSTRIYLNNATNNSFINNTFIEGATKTNYDISSISNASLNTFLNNSFNKSDVGFGAGVNNFTVMEYIDVNVTYGENGTKATDVTVNVSNASGSTPIISQNTTPVGTLNMTAVVEFIAYGIYNYSNYTSDLGYAVNNFSLFSLYNVTVWKPNYAMNSTNITVNGTNTAQTSTVLTLSLAGILVDKPLIEPATAYGNSTLNCSTTARTVDPVMTVTVNFTWYNGSAGTVYYNSSTFLGITNGTNVSALLPAGIQASAETWNCTAFASNGSVNGPLNSTTRAITALQPYVGVVNITPVIAYKSSTLNCTALVYDDDLRSIKVNFTWYNGSGGTVYYNSSTFSTTNGSFVSALLPASAQASGETWNCTINISAGTSDGYNKNSSTKIISSTAPSVINVTIMPNSTTEYPYGNSTLNCSFEVYDTDSSDALKINVSWFNSTTYYNSSTFSVAAGSRSAAGYYNYSLWLGQGITGSETPQAKGNTWNCSVNVSDASADALKSNTTYIVNTLPTLSLANFTLTPASPYKTSVGINCTITAGDLDLDALTYTYLWYKNNVSTGVVTQNITNASFDGGDVLTCQGIANDGTGNSAKVNSSNLTILNTAPSVINVTIMPNSTSTYPYGNSTLNCSFEVYDINLNDNLLMNISWYNGTVYYNSSTFTVAAGSRSAAGYYNYSLVLNGGVGSETPQAKGNTWNCSVNLSDASLDNLKSNTTSIVNTAPTIQNVTILPLNAYGNSTLNCTAYGQDIDLDSMSVNFTWYNGTVYYNSSTFSGITNGTSKSFNLGADVANGETWNCTAFFNDGVSDSAINSTTRTIGNTAPMVTNITILPLTAYGNSTLNCTVYGEDIDLDSISVNFTWYNGSTYYNSSTFSGVTNGTSKSFNLGADVANGETWNCTAFFNDGVSDSAINSTTRTIGSLAPYIGEMNITPALPDKFATLNCSARVYDNDLKTLTVNFTWYNGSDGIVYYNSSTKTSVNGSVVSALLPIVQAKGEYWNCTVFSNDGALDSINKNSTVIKIYGYCGDGACDSEVGEATPTCPGDCPGACSSECSSGDKECLGSTTYRICGNYDADPCYEWSSTTSCGTGQICSSGNCIACTNDCTLGTKECINTTVQRTCITNATSGCTIWSTAACSSGEKCTNGNCLTCNENWTCDDWQDCDTHIQRRTCTDLNGCGTTYNKPADNRSCNNIPVLTYDPQNLNIRVYNNTAVTLSVTATDADKDDMSLVWQYDGNTIKEQQGKTSLTSSVNAIINGTVVTASVADGYSTQTVIWIFSVIAPQSLRCDEDWACEWTECYQNTSRRYAQNCTDNSKCGSTVNIPFWQQCRCQSNWTCDSWSECEIKYTVGTLLEEKEFASGKQKRVCEDLKRCFDAYKKTEIRNCTKRIEIKANCTEFCGEKYLEIYERDTGRLVGRIKESVAGNQPSPITGLSIISREGGERCANVRAEASLDIDLSITNLSKEKCWWCYDGIKDYDEDGVDCGGKYCSPCSTLTIPTFTIIQIMTTFFFILGILLLVIYLVTTIIPSRKRKEYPMLLDKAIYEKDRSKIVREIEQSRYKKMLSREKYKEESKKIAGEIVKHEERTKFKKESSAIAKEILKHDEIKQDLLKNIHSQDKLRDKIVRTKDKREFEKLDNELHKLKKEFKQLKSRIK